GAVEALTIDGLAGDDRFAFDDNSSPTTVNGGDGSDTFQVGQLYGQPVLLVWPVDFTTTTRGDLSNGVSFATTLDGTAGDDHFIVLGTAPTVTTTIYGGLGSDTIDVGDGANGVSNVAGALIVDGGVGPATPAIPPPVLLPGESSSPLPLPANPSL